VDEFQYQIDLLKAQNQKLNGECSMYRTLVNTSGNAYLYYSYREDACQVMGDWDRFFDIQVRNRNDLTKLFSQVREEDVEPLRNAVYIDEKDASFAVRDFCKKDKKQWLECQVNVIRDEMGEPQEKLLRFRDITQFKKQNDDLAYMAYYDTLTGMYNRNRFIQELAGWLRQAEAEKTMVSVAFININDFRKINDGIGVLVGDELLQQFGRFLRGLCTDENMMCAHLNGDAYCMAVYDPYGRRTVEDLYRQIHERLEQPFVLTEHQVSITVSVGVAEYPEAAQEPLALIERAEIVMFKVKHEGKSVIRYFDAPIIEDFVQNAQMERKLKHAVLEKEFLLYYQPQFDTETKHLRGVEALIRWKDEDGRIISPGEFIPIAEKSSLIVDIGEWVMEKAVSILARLKKKFGISLIMSINISAVHFAMEEFSDHLIQLVEEYGISPEEIELEFTETVLMNDASGVIKKLELLRQYGIQTAIDDFGTGYSAFSYLRSLPVQTIKIDKSFIDSMLQDENGNIIVECIVDMVNRLGYDTIAEGVEQQEQLEYLRDIGCEYIQGYLLGRPMPEKQLEELLEEQLEKQVWE
jgi:diguanylate cyclase (GGDEF)-like protein